MYIIKNLYFPGWVFTVDICFMELSSICTLGNEICLHNEVSLTNTTLNKLAAHVLCNHNAQDTWLSLFLSGLCVFFCLFVLWVFFFSPSPFLCRHSFLDDHYVEFSKLSQDRVIGTKEHIAHVRNLHIPYADFENVNLEN